MSETAKPADALLMADGDDVAVLLRPGGAGETLRIGGPAGEIAITLAEPVPQHHKVALRAIARGERVRRAGIVIGAATADIPAGACVHTHNLRSLRA